MDERRKTEPESLPPPAPLDGLARLRRARLGPILFALMTIWFVSTVIWLGGLLPTRIDNSFPEGSIAERAYAVSLGRPLYTDWRAWPHTFAPYGPLQYVPVGWIERLLPGPADSWRVMMLGRGQSLLSLIVIGFLLYRMARRIGLPPVWALMAVAANASWGGLLDFCVSFRPDAPAAAAAIGALFLTMRGPAHGCTPLWPLGLSMVSMGFKPTAWAILALAFIWIVQSQGWRRGLVWFVGWNALAVGLALGLDALCDGRFMLNLVGGNRQGFSTELLAGWARQPWRLENVCLLLGTVVAIAALRRSTANGNAGRLASLAALLSLAVSLLLCLKDGADKNYLLIPYLLLMLTLTLGVYRAWHGRTPLRPVAREALLWLALAPAVAIPTLLGLASARYDFGRLLTGWKLPIVLQRLQGAPGPILTTHPFIPLQAGNRPTVMDSFAYAKLAEQGLLDTAPLRERIERREFAAIVLDDANWQAATDDPELPMPIFFEGFVPLVNRHYKPIDRPGMFIVLLPREGP
jgi:hypothetical protein